jgi:hypothetical protein
MDNEKKYKHLISIIEGLVFVLLLISSILAIFDLVSTNIIFFSDIFNLWSLRIAVISFILFLILPYLMIYLKKIAERAFVKYNQQRFKKRFFEELKELKEKEINVLSISRRYDVNFIYVKNYLRDQISEGLLKGEMKDDIFYIKDDFKIMDIKEKRIEFMKQSIGRFISPHRWIKFRDIASNFKIPKDVVMHIMKKQINEGVLRGYIEGDTFIKDLSLPEEIECPHCNKKFNPKENEE